MFQMTAGVVNWLRESMTWHSGGVGSRLRSGLVLGCFALLLVGCAHRQADTTVCAEYRSLRCVAGSVCSLDRRRGCRVCHCAVLDQDPQGSPDQVVPADGRRPDPIAP